MWQLTNRAGRAESESGRAARTVTRDEPNSTSDCPKRVTNMPSRNDLYMTTYLAGVGCERESRRAGMAAETARTGWD